MKKGLSVLLIAAALFGFYGGATNLNDVLACKDYWEKAGEKSTADMNKLEDGLNQLKDNEQAYLDGQDALVEGEAALADAEQQLAAGEAELAKGLADYAAAPGKLADARKKLADGEKALADGEQALEDGKNSIDGLTQLINGIKQVRNGYNNDWRPGYEKLKDGRNQLYKGSKGSKQDLTDLATFLESGQKAYVDAVNDVAGDDEKQAASDYKDFIKSTNRIAKDLPKIQKKVKETYEGASALLGALKAQETNIGFAKVVSAKKTELLALAQLIEKANGSEAAETYKATINAVANAIDTQYPEAIETNTEAVCNSTTNPQTGAANPGGLTNLQAGTVQYLMGQGMSQAQAVAYMSDPANAAAVKQIQEGVKEQIKASVTEQVNADFNSASGTAGSQLTAAKVGLTQQYAKSGDGGVIGVVVASLKDINEKVNGENSALKNTLLPGLKQFNAAATSDAVDQLSDGQDTISDGVAQIASAVLGNKTLKAGVKKNFGSKAIKLLKAYKSAKGPLSTKQSNFAAFEKQMDSDPGIDSFLKKAQKLLQKTKAEGQKSLAAGKKTLAAGKKTLADGKAQYAKGLADYKAAPAKLADGKAKLADGYAQYEDGKQQLADGKAKLAEYEDGEQQVRDGLATLVGTEPDLGLTSILDRLGGDDDFDNGDGHLELDEGLAAVDAGRGYQAEDGVLITDEIMARAVGTGGLIGAGVLAVLAAILSFLKKNKGAGVFAILAAVAGVFGAAYGANAGTYFSDIAGSTAGNAAWVAAGILAAIAAVHAVVHFAAKKEA